MTKMPGKKPTDLDDVTDAISDLTMMLGEQFEMIGWQFERIDDQFKRIDERFVAIDARFDGVENRLFNLEVSVRSMDNRLGRVKGEVEAMGSDIKEIYHLLPAHG